MTYDEAISYWFGRINFEVRSARPSDLKLERMRALMHLLGDPQDRLRIVHITGTKGKGSTAAILTSILRSAGYRTGLFTSPHLEHVEERAQVDGVPISRLELTHLIEEIAAAVACLESTAGLMVSFFEIGTALAFLHFCRRRVDFAIVEVGLGGRFDSTNICTPIVSILTSVGIDHTVQLGNTLELIAYQKAGIIKRGIPVICGVMDTGPLEVIRNIARELNAPIHECGTDFRFHYRFENGQALVKIETSQQRYPWLELALLGRHQALNSSIAVEAIEFLRRRLLPIPDRAIREGLNRVKWPARIEVVGRDPIVILDTAHNVASAQALVETLRETFPEVQAKRLVFAVSSDKQYREILAILACYFDHFYVTRYRNNPRGVAPEKLVEELVLTASPEKIRMESSSELAWKAARADSQSRDLICITGSVFLAGELQSLLR